MIQLSPSKLSVLDDCPRCFYLENKEGIKRPRGIFPSLPGGIDRVLKTYYDAFRPRSLMGEPQPFKGYRLFGEIALLNKWRNWRSGLTCMVEGVKLIGALDDCLINSKGLHSPLDYKTKGSEPKDDGSQYYQTQLDCYDLMLSHNGFPTSGISVLVYYWPVSAITGGFKFQSKYFEIPSSAVSAVEKIIQAKRLLEGKIPEASDDCEYCRYENQKKVLRVE